MLRNNHKVFSSLLLLLIIVVGFSVNYVKKFTLNDDNLYLYHSIATVINKDFQSISMDKEILSESLSSNSENEQLFSSRWQLRANYADNYIASLYAFSIGNSVSALIFSEDSFEKQLIANINMAFLFPAILFTLVVVLSLYLWDRPVLTLAMICTVLLVYLLNEYIPRGGQNLYDYGIANFIKFILNPGYGLTPLGFTPRNHLMMLSFLVIIFWLSNRVFYAYLGMFLLLFFHNSMAFLLMPFLFIGDVIFRIKLILRLNIAIIFTAIAFVYLGRESLFDIFGQEYFLSIGIFLFSLAFIITVWKFRQDFSLKGQFEVPTMIKLSACMVCFWLIIFLFVLLFSFLLPNTTFPVWHVFPGRSLALIRPLVIFAIFLIVFSWFYKDTLSWKTLNKYALTLAVFASLGGVHQIYTKYQGFYPDLLAKAEFIDQKSADVLDYHKDNEMFFYYRMIKNSKESVIDH